MQRIHCSNIKKKQYFMPVISHSTKKKGKKTSKKDSTPLSFPSEEKVQRDFNA